MFKVGDIVKPIKTHAELYAFKHYEVLEIEKRNTGEVFLVVEDLDNGNTIDGYYDTRFKLVNDNMHIINGK
jgi:hypothetical protein